MVVVVSMPRVSLLWWGWVAIAVVGVTENLETEMGTSMAVNTPRLVVTIAPLFSWWYTEHKDILSPSRLPTCCILAASWQHSISVH